MKRFIGWTFVVFCLGVMGSALYAEDLESELPIIPWPVEVEQGEGSFVFDRDCVIVVPEHCEGIKPAVGLLGELFQRSIGQRAPVHVAGIEIAGKRPIVLESDADQAELPDEAYRLEITPKRLSIRASSPAGTFYAVQTIRQLAPARAVTTQPVSGPEPFAIPAVTITDRPRFGYRGLMLDCSRTFLRIEYLERYIDLLAFYKMNVLHLHLTDDQGWRVEIDAYPKLTEVGSKFDPAFPDEVSGYYSKQEIRDLVRYAADRNVTLIPEIEMPGHCLAALTAYPELSCQPQEYVIAPWRHMASQDPNKSPATPYGVFCVGNDKTFQVLEGVLAEVIEMFPSKYIHIGGDEVPKVFWENCPKCQARMNANDLENEKELQSYFIKRIGDFIESKGRRMIGWTEIMEGGLAEDAVVMAWLKTEDVVEAARHGNDVIVAVLSHLYFDYPYEATPLKKTYGFDPIPESLTSDQVKHILGLQGAMWTHVARTEPEIDRMILPRMIASAEVAWAPKGGRDWGAFSGRITEHYRRLDRLGLEYHRAEDAIVGENE